MCSSASRRGLSDEKLSTIVAGQRPVDLTREEAIAHDFASALMSGGVLPELTYRTAVEAFGPARRSRIVLPGRTLRSRVDHAEHIRCAGA